MNRAELVEKAAVVIANYLDPVREKKRNGQYDEFDYGQASAVVDALLPLMTTVEELDRMYETDDRRTVLMDTRGDAHRLAWVSAEVLELYGPLTIVWRPS